MSMSKAIALPASLAEFLARRPGAEWRKIHAEASRRSFVRIRRGRGSLVAMVYPAPAPEDVRRFCALQEVYRRYGLRVPRIHEVLDDRVVLLEDLGDMLLQRAWRGADRLQRGRWLERCREILGRLAAVPQELAPARLDEARRKWEMDFFLAHFSPRHPVRGVEAHALRSALHLLAGAVHAEDTFAHRDFHSRNLLVRKREIVMVDFQDSLVAPRFYDLVSLAFDSYLDLGAWPGRLFPNLAAWGDDGELRQLRLTALQRNVKALGTFAFQMFERRHPAYARYIPRTLRHIRGHLQVLADPQFEILTRYFESVTRDA
ncbi:MAG: phosphotransferase [Candidatus Aminicenantes bacterium]|nr:phosphotransferase [Candidatus Aminicenantes bacterium]